MKEVFDHDKLDVYRVAIEFIGTASTIAEALPQGRAYIVEQLNRAALSISLNIAEGAGEFSKKEKRRFYRMAKRSATECAAILDICQCLKLAESKPIETGKEQLERIVSMLVRLASTS